MRFFSLGSGSSGNAFLLLTERAAVLFDAGVAARTCASSLAGLLGGRELDAIIVSHEHIDHVRALPTLLRKRTTPLISTHGTRQGVAVDADWTRAVCGGSFSIGDVDVQFVSVAHDAQEPCGFVIEAAGQRIALFTDLGHVGLEALDALPGCDIVVLEANYDRSMLQSGPYPARLKRRIQGPTGHLSNDDSASALVATLDARTRAIWLAHLSHTNNTPAAAAHTVTEALRLHGLATPVQALPRFAVADLTAFKPEQLTLELTGA